MKIKTSFVNAVYLIGVALLVMAARGLPLWLLTVIIVLALGAPLVREFGKKALLDERQIYIGHFSSHIAFFVFLALILFVMLREFLTGGKNPDPQWYLLLLVPLVVKLLLNVFMNYGAVRASAYVAYFFGAVWLIFTLASHGLSFEALIEGSPFVLILFLGWLTGRQPTWAGILFLVLTAGLLVLFRGFWRLDVYVRLLMYALVPLPLLASGLMLLLSKQEEDAA